MTLSAENIAPFDFLTAGQIRFGRGTAMEAAKDVARFGKRVLLVRGQSVSAVDAIAAQLEDLGCTVTSVFGQGEPSLSDVEAAVTLGRDVSTNVVLSVGGGAVLDLGKAVAAMIPTSGSLMDHLEGVGRGKPLVANPLPFIAIPSTAGTGSEVTKNAVISVPEAGRKVSLRDNRMLPNLAVVDPSLTDGSPREVTFASGFDAVTQVIEPYLSTKANPLTDALCRSAIPMGLAALAILAKTEDPKARDEIAFVSLVGGIVLANAGLGAVHGLAGVIGGRFGAPHGLICARLLGPVLCLNKAALSLAEAPIERYTEIESWIEGTFGQPAAGSGMDMLNRQLDELNLARLGNWIDQDADLGSIAAEAVHTSSFQSNPVMLSEEDLSTALLAAT